jgi:hypothetical protein
MLTPETLKKAKEEAERFLERLTAYQSKVQNDSWAQYGCAESGALKRSSMDLTRALAELRRGRLID